MKTYLKSLLIFFIVSIIVLLSISLLKSGAKGNKEYIVKYNDLVENHPKTNTIAFGSSHVFRQFKPDEFDRVTKLTSYNLGTPAADGLQNIFLLEEFLCNYENIENIDYVLFEYLGINKIKGQNHQTLRNSYYLSTSTLPLIFETYGPWYKEPGLGFIKAYLLRKLSFKNILFNTEKKRLTKKNTKYCLKERGYLALETDLRVTKNEKLISRKNYFDSHEEELLEKFAGRDRQISIKQKNKPILNRLNQLSLLKEYEHIKFLIVIHPMYPMLKTDSYKNLGILNLSQKDHKSILSEPKNYFDKGHLGKKGAKAFSNSLGKSFNKLMKNKSKRKNK